MRKGISSLSILVHEQMDLNVFEGDLFVFCNRMTTMVKALYWEETGFCLWQKRLETEKFKWPRSSEEVVEVGMRELNWLLAGLDITHAHRELHYEIMA